MSESTHISVREPIPAEHARTLEARRDTWREDGIDHDEVCVSVNGPRGRVYGIAWLATADFVQFCRQVTEAYGDS